MTRKTEVFEIGDFKSKVLNKIISVKYEKQNYSQKYSPKGWNIIFYDKHSYVGEIASISIKDERLKFHMYLLRKAHKNFPTHICYHDKYFHKVIENMSEQHVLDFVEEFKRAYKNKQLKSIV